MVSLKHGAMVFAMAVAALVAAPAGAEDPAPLPPPGEPVAVPGTITCLEIVGCNPNWVYLRVEGTPELWGRPMSIRFGPAPGAGWMVGQYPLEPGASVVAVPNYPMPGWYTVNVGDAVRSVEDDEVGCY